MVNHRDGEHQKKKSFESFKPFESDRMLNIKWTLSGRTMLKAVDKAVEIDYSLHLLMRVLLWDPN